MSKQAIIKKIDKLVVEVLAYYPTDIFPSPTDEDYAKINAWDANLNTRLHCEGIRHGLHLLRRHARELEARDDLELLT